MARFYKLEKQQETGSHTYPQSGTQCGTGLTTSPSVLVMLSRSPTAPKMKSTLVFMTEGRSQSAPSCLLLWSHLFSLPTTHPSSSWTRLLIPAQTHVLPFTPPASIHSIPASQYVHLSFSRNSDCWLHISTFLRPNTMNLHPKNSGWVSHIHS